MVKIIFYSLLITICFYILNLGLDLGYGYLLGVEYEYISHLLTALTILLILLLILSYGFKNNSKKFKNRYSVTIVLFIAFLALILRVFRDPIYMYPYIFKKIDMGDYELPVFNVASLKFHIIYVIDIIILIPIVEELVF